MNTIYYKERHTLPKPFIVLTVPFSWTGLSIPYTTRCHIWGTIFDTGNDHNILQGEAYIAIELIQYLP